MNIFLMSDGKPKDGEAREEFLTARQLAAVLQVSESTVRRLARRGRLPAIHITPRIMRFHLSAVRKALDGANRSRTSRHDTQDDAQLSFADLI